LGVKTDLSLQAVSPINVKHTCTHASYWHKYISFSEGDVTSACRHGLKLWGNISGKRLQRWKLTMLCHGSSPFLLLFLVSHCRLTA